MRSEVGVRWERVQVQNLKLRGKTSKVFKILYIHKVWISVDKDRKI